jgi:aspartyl-tRNA(Asn)/glutamyl-tRNA(Gln) amidotransferase subunit C
MSSPEIDVQYVADLARLKLSPEEISKFQKQLSDVLSYVTQLQKVDVSSVETSLNQSALENNLRPDVVAPSLPVAEALANAPLQSNDLIMVPKIVE